MVTVIINSFYCPFYAAIDCLLTVGVGGGGAIDCMSVEETVSSLLMCWTMFGCKLTELRHPETH